MRSGFLLSARGIVPTGGTAGRCVTGVDRKRTCPLVTAGSNQRQPICSSEGVEGLRSWPSIAVAAAVTDDWRPSVADGTRAMQTTHTGVISARHERGLTGTPSRWLQVVRLTTLGASLVGALLSVSAYLWAREILRASPPAVA